MRRGPAIALTLASIAIAALVHPLMATYGLGCAALLACFLAKSPRVRVVSAAALSLLAILVAAVLYKAALPEPAAYLNVAQTRTYWFVARWQSYEQFGLAAPLAILGAIALERMRPATAAARALASAGAVAGAVGCTIAVLFARIDAPTYVVARLQPLRIFQIVYVLMILAVGAFLGEWLLQRKAWRWLATFAALATIMLCVQRWTFPSSLHFESPGRKPENAWVHAFEWIRVKHAGRCAFRARCTLRKQRWGRRADLSRHRRTQRAGRLLQGWRRGIHYAGADRSVVYRADRTGRPELSRRRSPDRQPSPTRRDMDRAARQLANELHMPLYGRGSEGMSPAAPRKGATPTEIFCLVN